jgi:hypothetical protein
VGGSLQIFERTVFERTTYPVIQIRGGTGVIIWNMATSLT